MLGLLAAVAPANAKGWSPKPGATFNVPRAGEKQYRLHQQIVGAINHARKGSTIKIAVFSFDRKNIAQALVKAHKRGVHVQVLLNNHQVTPAQKLLHRALGRNRFKTSFAYECTRGCRSRGENLHTKMYLFNRTGAARYVVMTGSVNLTKNSAVNQYNDIYIRNNSPAFYKGFDELFQQMRKDRPQGYWAKRIGDKVLLQATPYPNFGPKHDPIMSILNQVHCKGAIKGTGNKAHRTIVRVVMHAWNESRGLYLAQKIRRLYAAGCDVRLMYGFAGESVRNTFATKTARGYLPVHTTGYDTNEDGFIDLYTHQKELLISGNYGKNRGTKMVVTGSSNWNPEGLKGDEEILSLKLAGAYNQYANNFQFMWTKKSHLVKYIPYPSAATPSALAVLQRIAGAVQHEAEPKRFGPAWEND
ncbi:phospholipase D-like domain-containing protein [Nocardioides sp.]|uniref:phospholipase D-like domain-containing protein n=1 Tax=Nocardioides sp. TaxID=35761 RepID=UPI003D108A5F